MEFKLRHVRTPAGVRKFHKPIGSPITRADVALAAARSRKASKSKAPKMGAVTLITKESLSNPETPRTRAVSRTEFMRLARKGQERLTGFQRNSSTPTALTENWDDTKQRAWDSIQEDWGGITMDTHSGTTVELGDDKYALTVKTPGQESVMLPIEGLNRKDFDAAMDDARRRFAPQFAREQHHLGVFRDADTGRIDIDPVLIVDSLDDVESIGAYTHAVGGAFYFKDENGYWPPYVKESKGVGNEVKGIHEVAHRREEGRGVIERIQAIREGPGQDPEVKAVRHVRTPEGVAKYGQPIGSVIVRDVIPYIPWMQAGSSAAQTRTANRKRRQRKHPMVFGGIEAPEGANTGSLPEYKGVSAHWVEFPPEEQPQGFPPGMKAFGVEFGIPARNRFGEVRIVIPSNPDDIEDAVKDMQREYANTVPPLTHRDKAPFEEYFDKSYLMDGEENWWAAKKRTLDHMVMVGGTEDDNGKIIEPSTYTVGVVNAVLSYYKKKYGSISPLIGRVRLTDQKVPTPDGPSDGYMAFEHDSAFDSPLHEMPVAELAMNAKAFPVRHQPTTEQDKTVMHELESNPLTAFTAVDVQTLAKNLDVDELTAFRLNVLHHETGHAITNLILGVNDDLENRLPLGTRFLLLRARQAVYGVMEDAASKDENGNILGLDPVATARWVSNYGATNLHEHLAEVWAAYTLQRDVTGYVAYLGQLIDETYRFIADALPDDPAPDDEVNVA